MLSKLEGYAAAQLGSLDAAALATVTGELASLEQTVLGHADLRAVLTDTSIAPASRGLIVHDLLDGKVHDVTLRVARLRREPRAGPGRPARPGRTGLRGARAVANRQLPARESWTHGLASTREWLR